MLTYARRLVGDAEQAQDAVQETFFRLCRQRASTVQPHLAEWLYTVCRNTALDTRRRKRAMQQVEEASRLTDSDSDPGAVTQRREEVNRALACLADLPAKQQEVLRLKFGGGLSYREISRVTGESVGNVGWLLHVGLKALRAKLTGEVPGEVTS